MRDTSHQFWWVAIKFYNLMSYGFLRALALCFAIPGRSLWGESTFGGIQRRALGGFHRETFPLFFPLDSHASNNPALLTQHFIWIAPTSLALCLPTTALFSFAVCSTSVCDRPLPFRAMSFCPNALWRSARSAQVLSCRESCCTEAEVFLHHRSLNHSVSEPQCL